MKRTYHFSELLYPAAVTAWEQTHVALGVAVYLTGYGIRSLYQEKNDSRSVLAMAEYLEQSPISMGYIILSMGAETGIRLLRQIGTTGI